MPIQITTNGSTKKQPRGTEKVTQRQEHIPHVVEVQPMNIEQRQERIPHVAAVQPANTVKQFDGVVSIVDTNVPIIVLYGPTSCGKSMTLVRLTNYLRSLGGYAVAPDRTFRPSNDID